MNSVYPGGVGIQTRPEDSLRLSQICRARRKQNCSVSIIPNLSHSMFLLRAPRRQKLVDETLGPVDQSFLKIMEILSLNL